jgi:hypothetical protein
MIKVKNIKGSGFYSDAPSGYSSWLDYWEKMTHRPAIRCSAMDCHQSRLFCTLVGAHVIKVDSSDRHYYIVPLCKGCNKRTDEFWVDEELVPSPSNL